MNTSPATYVPGLEGIVAAQTRLSRIDGQNGQLAIAGFPLEVLASRASFEETLFLLWYDRLPTVIELEALQATMAAQRVLPAATEALLEAAVTASVPVMDVLRVAVDSLRLSWPPGLDNRQQAVRIIAVMPVIVATYWRMQQGLSPLLPQPQLGHAANFLYLLFSKVPSAAQVRGLETYLNTVVDHGLNASTFAARVIISTRADMLSAVVGALGALAGPLHGGAPGPALDMVLEIGHADQAEAYLRDKLERGERLMGFGHRVYKVRDPRAAVLSEAASHFFAQDGDQALYELAIAVEATAVRLLAEYKPGRRLQTNVEFYTALLLYGLGLENALFTPTFALARVVGWTAHAFEQDRLLRPQGQYIGVTDRAWVPPNERNTVTAAAIA